METIVGTLTEIGPSQTGGGWTKYSYIKVDGQTITKLYSTPAIETILRGQLNKGQITIHVGKMVTSKTIFAITQADGQTFRASAARQFLTPFLLQPGAFLAAGMMSGASETAAVITFLVIQAIFGHSIYQAFKIRAIKADHVF